MNNAALFFSGLSLGIACFFVLEQYRRKENRRKYRQFQKSKFNQLEMSKASYRAFMEGLNENRRDTLKETIYRGFVEGPKNRRALAVYLANQGLHPSMSSITGRISELQDMGAIKEATEGVYQVCRTEAEQEAQREARYHDRKRRWVNEGVRNGWIRDPWADTTKEEIVESLL